MLNAEKFDNDEAIAAMMDVMSAANVEGVALEKKLTFVPRKDLYDPSRIPTAWTSFKRAELFQSVSNSCAQSCESVLAELY